MTNVAASQDQVPDSQDWPQPPPALTRRGILIGIALLIFASSLAALSIYLRRTSLERTKAFFGDEVVTAIQSGPRIWYAQVAGPDVRPAAEDEHNLTDLPGFGHFRHALIDDRHYEWKEGTATPEYLSFNETTEAKYYYLRFMNPQGGDPVELIIDGPHGRVRSLHQTEAAQLKERSTTAVAHYLKTLTHIKK